MESGRLKAAADVLVVSVEDDAKMREELNNMGAAVCLATSGVHERTAALAAATRYLVIPPRASLPKPEPVEKTPLTPEQRREWDRFREKKLREYMRRNGRRV